MMTKIRESILILNGKQQLRIEIKEQAARI